MRDRQNMNSELCKKNKTDQLKKFMSKKFSFLFFILGMLFLNNSLGDHH